MTDMTEACWTKTVSVAELAAKPIHGHVFRLQPDGSFVVYEFHEGEARLNDENIRSAPFQDFADFLHRNGPAGLLALEVLDSPQDHAKMELQVGPQGTVLFYKKMSLE